MAIDSKVVAQVAHLARLKVDPQDSDALSNRLNDILAMAVSYTHLTLPTSDLV